VGYKGVIGAYSLARSKRNSKDALAIHKFLVEGIVHSKIKIWSFQSYKTFAHPNTKEDLFDEIWELSVPPLTNIPLTLHKEIVKRTGQKIF